MKKKITLVIALILTASLLFGCGAALKDAGMSAGSVNGSPEREEILSDSIMQESAQSKPGESGSGNASAPITNQKLVRKLWLNGETEDLDALLSQIQQRITELSGYVEAREVSNRSKTAYSRRSATLTVRIPADKLDDFVSHVSENANITSSNETTDDITLSYVATQSRITALETEQTRLLELLAKAETVDDLLRIESRLTDVRTELEKVTSQLRLYDNMVSYGTMYLTLNEVKEYTVTEAPETVWERIGAGFMGSLKNLGNFFTELFVFMIVALPYLIPIAIVVVALILLIKKRNKKRNPPTEQQ